MPDVFLIAAVARNGVIGAGNDMPWQISSDLKHFKALTLGKPVIMGRKTFLSLGKPLPGRPNLVVSRDAGYAPEGAEVFQTLEAAMARAGEHAGELGTSSIAVIGGGQIYKMAIAQADRLEITEIAADPEGDTYFPAIDPDIWEETQRKPGVRTERDSANFDFVTYRRRAK